ncbi:hypothetical protein TOTSKI_00910 [Facklamia hominis]
MVLFCVKQVIGLDEGSRFLGIRWIEIVTLVELRVQKRVENVTLVGLRVPKRDGIVTLVKLRVQKRAEIVTLVGL